MSAHPSSLVQRYDALVAQGELLPDPSQRAAVEKLQALADALDERRVMSIGLARALSAIFRGDERPTRGLYLWGPVGRGKTLLMNLFFDALAVGKKRRAHFHAFMNDVHERLHRARQDAGGCDDDPVSCVARDIADETRVLCFDEFAVNDIADATILARLFSALLESGVVVVATSNVEPARLYEGGRNRDLFLPFIALLQERMDIVRLEAPSDYRRRGGAIAEVYFTPPDARARAAIDALFRTLANGAEAAPETLVVRNRKIEIPLATGPVARFGFAQICGQALAAADYLALARRFSAVIVEDVPILAPEQRNEARRFIMLVDVLYEARALLIVSAAGEPGDLYHAPYGAEAREFERAASRLIEMRGKDYIEHRMALTAATCTP
jgi:cell division protein ZapE